MTGEPGAARWDLLEPQYEVGSLTVDPGLPLDGGLAIVAVLGAIPWGRVGSSK
jgi:hypothetical protein